MASYDAWIKVAGSNATFSANALSNDIVLYPTNPTQNIVFGISNSMPGTLTITSNNLYVGGNIIPVVDSVTNIGTSNIRFRSVYISSNTIDIQGVKLSVNPANASLLIADSNGSNVSMIVNALRIGTPCNLTTISLDVNNNLQVLGSSNGSVTSTTTVSTKTPGNTFDIDSNNSATLSISKPWSILATTATDYIPAKTMAINGTSGNDAMTCIILDNTPSNIYVSGTYVSTSLLIYNSNNVSSGATVLSTNSNTSYMVKYNSNGILTWVTAVDGVSTNTPTIFGLDNSNSVITMATTYSIANPKVYNTGMSLATGLNILPAPNPSTALMVRYNTNGSALWNTIIDSTRAVDMGVDSIGSSFVALTSQSRPTIYDIASYINSTSRYVANGFGAVSTLAGSSGLSSFADGSTSAATFNFPYNIAVDSSGNLYISDSANHRIRKISAGVVTTLAGSGTATYFDATGTLASFSTPKGIAVDSSGNVYVADTGNQCIRKITSAGVVSSLAGSGSATFAEGTGIGASFNNPTGVAVDSSGNVYVADSGNNKIRKITSGGTSSTLAGSGIPTWSEGSGAVASFNSPQGVAVDTLGNVYVADYNNNRVRKITSAGLVSTLAGSGTASFSDGTGSATGFRNPISVAVDTSGNVYVGDYNNNRIRKITSGGTVTTLAGSGSVGFQDATGVSAVFYAPIGVAVDSSLNVYICDSANHRIRRCTSGGVVTTFAGSGLYQYFADGTGSNTSFLTPNGIVVDSSGNAYVCDTGNHRIRKITPAGVVTTFAGSGTATFFDSTGTSAGFNSPQGIAIDTSGNLYVADTGNNRVRRITTSAVVSIFAGSGTATFFDATGASAGFNGPQGITVDVAGNLYVADTNNNRIRKITTGGTVTNFAGTGTATFFDSPTGTSAGFNVPRGIVVDALGNNIYVADYNNNRIRQITLAGVVTTLAGSGTATLADGTGSNASFFNPSSITIDALSTLYVSDDNGHAIRKMTISGGIGTVITINGSLTPTASYADAIGTTARFNRPRGLSIDSIGNLYVADQANNRVRRIDLTPIYTAITAGSGTASNMDGRGVNATFNNPTDLAIDSFGIMYVSDSLNHTIRKIAQNGDVTTFAGSGTTGFTNGPSLSTSFNTPKGIASDSSGNIFVADTMNHSIRRITPAGLVTTFAGTGTFGFFNATGTAASFNTPIGISIDSSGNIYVADSGNHAIRKITSTGVVSTLAGSGTASNNDGTGSIASFNHPYSTCVDALGNVYVADFGNQIIRRVSSIGVVVTIAGSGTASFADGLGTLASFNGPNHVILDPYNNLIVTDQNNKAIRKVLLTAANHVITMFTSNAFNTPMGTTIDSFGNIYIADQGNNMIRELYILPIVNTFAGSGAASFGDGTGITTGFNGPQALTVDISGNIFVADTGNHRIRRITPVGVVTNFAGSGTATFFDATGASAGFNGPQGIVADSSGNLWVSDSSNHRIRKITSGGVVTIFAGSGAASFVDGTFTGSSFNTPRGIAIDRVGNLYIADSSNHRIRKITTAGVVTTLAGSGAATFANGQGTNAGFNSPSGMVLNDATMSLYVADQNNNQIRMINLATQNVTTFVGSGIASYADGITSNAAFNNPLGISIDSLYNLYVADTNNNRIRMITPSGVVTTLAGSGAASYIDTVGTNAAFNLPRGVTIDLSGNLYVTDTQNNRIRRIPQLSPITNTSNLLPSTISTIPSPAISAAASIVKYSPSGYSQWAVNTTGSSSDTAYAVAIDASNNSYLIGTYGSNASPIYQNITPSSIILPPTMGSNAAFGIKIDPNGIPQWIIRIDGIASKIQPNACKVDKLNNLYIAGKYLNQASFYDTSNIARISLPNVTTSSAFLAKFDSNGTPIWMSALTGYGSNSATSIDIDSFYNVYLLGTYSSNTPNLYYSSNVFSNIYLPAPSTSNSTFMIKYNASGVPIGTFSIGGTASNSVGSKIATDIFGSNIYTVGFYTTPCSIYNGNGLTNSITLPTITSQGGFVTQHNVSSSPFYLNSGLSSIYNGLQKFVTNNSGQNLSLNVMASNRQTVLNAYTINNTSNIRLSCYNGVWYKFI